MNDLVSAFNWVLRKDSFSTLNVVLVLEMTERQTPQAYMLMDGNEMFCSDNSFRGSVFSRMRYSSRERWYTVTMHFFCFLSQDRSMFPELRSVLLSEMHQMKSCPFQI